MFDLLEKILGPIKTYIFGLIVSGIAIVSLLMLWKLKALEYKLNKLQQENEHLHIQLRLEKDQCKTKLFEVKNSTKKQVVEQKIKQIEQKPVITIKPDTENKKPIKKIEKAEKEINEGTTNDKSETIPDKPGNYIITIH